MSISVKKFIVLGIFVLSGFTLFAQDSTAKAPVTKKDRKQQDRLRKASQSKQEEEGVLNYSKQTAFGLQVRTNGYGLFFELGRSRSPRFTNLYMIELTEIKHPKEEKVSNVNQYFSNAFVYGKINNFYQAKLGFGQQYVFGQKGNKNGVAVLAIAEGGLSVGLLKPYYVQVQDQTTGNVRDIKYDSEDSSQFIGGNIIGGSGFTKGWSELKIKPGVFIKTALRFDFNRFNETIQALEIGMSLDAYASKIPQMAYNEPQRFFFQGHFAIVFGRRK